MACVGEAGLQYGPAFRGLEGVNTADQGTGPGLMCDAYLVIKLVSVLTILWEILAIQSLGMPVSAQLNPGSITP